MSALAQQRTERKRFVENIKELEYLNRMGPGSGLLRTQWKIAVAACLVTVSSLALLFLFNADQATSVSLEHERKSDQRNVFCVRNNRIVDSAINPSCGAALERLGQMRPRDKLREDGLRFVVMPPFSDISYGVVFFMPSANSAAIHGILTTFRGGGGGGKANVRHRSFNMPDTEYQALVSIVARTELMTDKRRKDKDNFVCIDSAVIAIERVHTNTITSGVGSCEASFTLAKDALLVALRRYAPEDDLPNEDDWQHRSTKD